MPVTQQQYALPYIRDSASLFAPIAALPWAVFLDSGFPNNTQGRYDIIAYDPITTLVTNGNTTTITSSEQTIYSDDDPFLLVKRALQPMASTVDGSPFNGGAIGYFSYDLARRLEQLPLLSNNAENLPEMVVGIYAWALIVDHQQQKSWLIAAQDKNIQPLIKQFSSTPTPPRNTTFSVLAQPQPNLDARAYQAAFNRIKAYLRAGDSYQVNLAQRFCSRCSGDPWQAYQALRQLNSAPFSAYLNFPQVQVLSASPERFLKVNNGEVESKPIKGTRPRLRDPAADQRQIAALSSSQKDRAENVMIVDLLRSDMSKNCQAGTVTVPKLFALESFATVHHLVSTVTGLLAADQHALDLLRSCFPGGSITGAPKIRAMEIIEELEPNRRGIYCGSIGYIGFDGNMDSNIAIRTLVHADQSIRFWAGGGIVNDSVMADEYQESFDKAAVLLQLLEQFRRHESH